MGRGDLDVLHSLWEFSYCEWWCVPPVFSLPFSLRLTHTPPLFPFPRSMVEPYTFLAPPAASPSMVPPRSSATVQPLRKQHFLPSGTINFTSCQPGYLLTPSTTAPTRRTSRAAPTPALPGPTPPARFGAWGRTRAPPAMRDLTAPEATSAPRRCPAPRGGTPATWASPSATRSATRDPSAPRAAPTPRPTSARRESTAAARAIPSRATARNARPAFTARRRALRSRGTFTPDRAIPARSHRRATRLLHPVPSRKVLAQWRRFLHSLPRGAFQQLEARRLRELSGWSVERRRGRRFGQCLHGLRRGKVLSGGGGGQ